MMARRSPPPWFVDHAPSTRRVRSIRISSAMLLFDSRTSSANGAFGRHEPQDSDVTGRKHETRRVPLVFRPPLPDPKRRGAAAHV